MTMNASRDAPDGECKGVVNGVVVDAADAAFLTEAIFQPDKLN